MRFLFVIKLYSGAVILKAMSMLATSVRIPTVEEVRSLSLLDLATASALADVLRDRLREYIQIDPCCVYDPFGDKEDVSYSVVLDRQNPNRVVAIIANIKNPLPQLPWSNVLQERLARVSLSKEEAAMIKHELMPKETANFYPYRRGGRIAGYIAFAFEICGLRET